MFAVRVSAETVPYGKRRARWQFMMLPPEITPAQTAQMSADDLLKLCTPIPPPVQEGALFYSVYFHERIHAERLAERWTRIGKKPPFDETGEIYEDQFAEVPTDFISLSTEIVDTKVDELCYNGDDPRYAPWYTERAQRIVAKLELDKPDGLWSK